MQFSGINQPKKTSQRIYAEVIPELEEIGIDYKITKNEEGVRFLISDYKLHIGGRTAKQREELT